MYESVCLCERVSVYFCVVMCVFVLCVLCARVCVCVRV